MDESKTGHGRLHLSLNGLSNTRVSYTTGESDTIPASGGWLGADQASVDVSSRLGQVSVDHTDSLTVLSSRR
ncbi:hypothetical protein D8S78_11875 [Natrialba swarupiae]|nr:hypothetical protein [Natrialba swarupiae]